MPTYRHIVELPYTSGLPKDVAVNVWHSVSAVDSDAAGFADALVTFYNAIDGLLSNQLSATAQAASVTSYDLSDPEPRVPTDVQTFTLIPNSSSLPPEVALCLSFQAAKVSGQPQSRRRGRVFLGPLGGIQDSNTSRPTSANITTITNAAAALLVTSGSPGVGDWAVYSPTDATARNVTDGWMDNEFDTVRRRGRTATTRTLFS